MVCLGRLAFNHFLGYSRKGSLCEGADGLDCFHCLKSIGKNGKVFFLGPFSVGIEDQLKHVYCNLTAEQFSSNCYLVQWTRRLELGFVSEYLQY